MHVLLFTWFNYTSPSLSAFSHGSDMQLAVGGKSVLMIKYTVECIRRDVGDTHAQGMMLRNAQVWTANQLVTS